MNDARTQRRTDERHSESRMRYVVKEDMWRGGTKERHSLGFSRLQRHIIFCV